MLFFSFALALSFLFTLEYKVDKFSPNRNHNIHNSTSYGFSSRMIGYAYLLCIFFFFSSSLPLLFVLGVCHLFLVVYFYLRCHSAFVRSINVFICITTIVFIIYSCMFFFCTRISLVSSFFLLLFLFHISMSGSLTVLCAYIFPSFPFCIFMLVLLSGRTQSLACFDHVSSALMWIKWRKLMQLKWR